MMAGALGPFHPSCVLLAQNLLGCDELDEASLSRQEGVAIPSTRYDCR